MTAMVIEVPEELKQVGDAFVALIEDASRRLRAAAGGRAVDYGAVEVDVAGKVAAIERAVHERVLGALDVDQPRVRIGGREHVRVGRHEATYHTLAGDVVVLRSLYRAAGERNGRTVDPVSLRAGVVADGWLPQTAQAMAHQVQRGPSREAQEAARELCRLPYSRCSFERVAHAVGELYVAQKEDVEQALIESYEVPAEAVSASVSLDRVAMPMEEPRPRPIGRPRKGAARRPIDRVFRMAYVGTVTLHDAEGNALHTIRYGRMPQGYAVGLCEAMGSDVEALLKEKPGLRIIALSDGAEEIVSLLREHICEAELGVPVDQLIDFWHLIEKLGAAATVIYGSRATDVLARWKLRVLNSGRALAEIRTELEASGRRQARRRVDGRMSRPVHEAITYLHNHEGLMGYAAARRAGLPIGSGSVEATCKSLVGVRMKRSGARWKEESGNHVLQLRALALSDRWSEGIHLTLRPLRKPVRVVA